MTKHIAKGDFVRSLIRCGSFNQWRINKGQVLEVVSSDERHVVVTIDGDDRICLLRREVETMLLSREVARTSGKRFWRVSAFPLGFTSIKTRPAVHKCSAKPEIAEGHYTQLCKSVGTKFGAVILHQGNLKWKAHKIHLRADAPQVLENDQAT